MKNGVAECVASKVNDFNPQVSCKVTKNGELVGLCLNKIDYLEETKRIPSFAEAVEGRDIFMNKILDFMDILYKVWFQNYSFYVYTFKILRFAIQMKMNFLLLKFLAILSNQAAIFIKSHF